MADEQQDRRDEDSGEKVSPPGTETLFQGSIRNEKHPEVTPQNPTDIGAKMKAETEGEEGLIAKAKRAVEEMDRDIGGDYQRREDPTAPSPLPDDRS
ncbi:MAG: hypothetical protein ABR564_07305 [Candidatus Dormibacteria bacterium]